MGNVTDVGSFHSWPEPSQNGCRTVLRNAEPELSPLISLRGQDWRMFLRKRGSQLLQAHDRSICQWFPFFLEVPRL